MSRIRHAASLMMPEQPGEIERYAAAYRRVPSRSMWPEIGRYLGSYQRVPRPAMLRIIRRAVVAHDLMGRYGEAARS